MKQAISLVLSLVFAGVSALSALAAGTSYDDVPATAWYAGAANWAAASGIISGYGNGRFGGETGSLVMELAPELFTAYLLVSSQWGGGLFAHDEKIMGWMFGRITTQ